MTPKTTREQLIEQADNGMKGQGAIVDASFRLMDSINELNRASGRLATVAIWLTAVAALLGLMQVVLAVISLAKH